MEYEHVVEEDDLGHTNSNGIVVIASSFAWNRASRSGSSAAPHSPNKMMTDKDNDNHNIKECGGSSEMTTSFSYYSALRCDSHSDNHRLKNTPTPKGKRWSHNSYHPDERHRPNVIVGGRAGSSRNVSPASLKMVLLLSVVFLVRGVTSVSSSSLPDSNRIDDEDRKVQNGHMWNNANDGGRGKYIQGLKTIEDIDLIKDDQQDDFNDPGNKDHYTHQWAVHILGGPEVARRVAEKHGFNFHGEYQKQIQY
ncbi:Furin [Orchesella cincta]|uniref:Furin n=1 Tax=Orchesella cincta TaxID=48709 RepID=A0A1D2MIE9_ORCCI|nr:Furin [Orchesella cincta]